MNNQEQRCVVLWGSHECVGKFYFKVPENVSLEEFKENPWDFYSGDFKVMSMEDGEIDVDEADEQFGGAA